MRSPFRFVMLVGCALWLIACSALQARAQPANMPDFSRFNEIEARFRQAAVDLDRGKIRAFALLAKNGKGAESEAAYRAAFDLALARDLSADAEPAARAYLARESAGIPQSQALAASIVLVSSASRGEYEKSLADLKTFLNRRAAEKIPEDQRLPPSLIFTVAEAYLQRLFQGGRYDIARKVCDLAAAGHFDPGVKAYFERRKARIEMIGKPAPPIEGTDVDGRTVRLTDFKGKVVVVDFWATWCPPCVATFPLLHRLAMEHKDQGFVLLGVNLDQMARTDPGTKATSRETTLKDVRWFLVAQRAGWPNLIGPGAEAAARAYSVEEIPARFLIGRDGTIQQLEQRDEALAQSVEQALARPAQQP